HPGAARRARPRRRRRPDRRQGAGPADQAGLRAQQQEVAHWWDKNRRKNRVEWLLEGLGHKDPEIRKSAVEDLRKATGEYFGYHHDLPRREREAARQRWLDWGNQTGRLRFLPPPEHEPPRPTRLLPPRR